MDLPDFVKDLINGIAVKENFLEYKLKTGKGSEHGDGYLGVMITVTINGTKKIDGKIENATMHLLCKVPPTSLVRRSVFHNILAFEREVEVYSKVLPIFEAFQKDKNLTNDKIFNAYPIVYATLSDKAKDHHILIMDDLRTKNFKMYPKEQRHDIDHATLIVTELAKYHAISFALKDQRPSQFEQIKTRDVFVQMLKYGKCKAVFAESFERTYRMLKDERHKQVMDDIKSNFINIWEKYTTDEEEIGEYGVLNHGDVWNNNVLFQYKENEDYKNPQGIMIVDWQLTRYASPVLDIYYYIATATDKPFRDEHYRNLLNIYHSTLSASIKKLGSDPEKLYPFNKFENDLKKYARFALIIGSVLTQFCIADQNQINDIEEYCERLANGEECYMLSNFDDNLEYSTHINDLFEDLFSFGYLN